MKTKKGDDKMEHKDLWLVLGLTVILAVAVSISTVSLTGDAIFGKVTKTTVTTPKVSTSIPLGRYPCKVVSEINGHPLEGEKPNDVCDKVADKGKTLIPVTVERQFMYFYYSTPNCKGDTLFLDRYSAILDTSTIPSVLEVSEIACRPEGKVWSRAVVVDRALLCCETLKD